MKKIIFILIITFLGKFYAAEKDSLVPSVFDKKNEIRIDMTKLIANGKIGLSYERFIHKKFSGGINAVLLMNRYSEESLNSLYDRNYENEYQINPYFRVFFHQRAKKVFFAETFLTFHGGKMPEIERLNDGQYAYYVNQYKPISGFGAGISVGAKYYIYDNLVLEFIVGAGSSKLSNKNVVGINRSGINVGYRF